ncbi:hypothetical protein [Falsiphaeobacter marinintestinus]|uniref:hypothetical protein n=1 Tax=Falsiphaeobacter marinintestinus TaxID=1492905 RepID=UPI0011B54F05|nr:hypothetical protein [Phaeobacter marinintestinus]
MICCDVAPIIGGKGGSGMTAQADLQKLSFQERVQRIEATHGADPSVTPAKVKAKPSKKQALTSPDIKADEEPRKLPRAGILTFVIGLAVMLAANVIAFRSSAVVGSYFAELLAAIGPFAIVGMILFVIMVGFGLRDKPHVIGLALGVPLMYFAEPYMASLAPEAWAQMYSVDHVDAMLVQAGLRDPIVLVQ